MAGSMKFLSSVSHSAWFLGNTRNVLYIRATKTRVTLLKVCPASDIDTPNKSATAENEHPCASTYRVKANCCSGVIGKGFKFICSFFYVFSDMIQNYIKSFACYS